MTAVGRLEKPRRIRILSREGQTLLIYLSDPNHENYISVHVFARELYGPGEGNSPVWLVEQLNPLRDEQSTLERNSCL